MYLIEEFLFVLLIPVSGATDENCVKQKLFQNNKYKTLKRTASTLSGVLGTSHYVGSLYLPHAYFVVNRRRGS